MKSDARLGDSAPSTSTPSTGVASPGSSAGEAAGDDVLLMTPNLGEATDSAADSRASYAGR